MALVVAAVIGTLVLAPSAVMSVLPGAARLYALFGAPVGAHGLGFEGVRYGWTSEGGQTVLEVQGDVVNLTAAPGRRADRGHRAPRRERRGNLRMDHRGRRGAARGRRACAVLAADPLAAEQCPQRQGAFRQGRVAWLQAAAAETVTPLYSAERIAERVEALSREIAASSPVDLVIVSILKGSFIFAADLIRALHREGLKPEIDFIFLASYGTGTISGGEVRVLRGVETELAGRDVVIVDDILDSGRTLAFAKALFEQSGARRVRTCVLVDKQVPRAAKIEPDFTGFRCPPVFVVGYGMDLAHRYRELPFIGEVRNP